MRIWDLRVFREFLSLVFATLHVMADAASAAFKSRAVLQLENLALRHQLGVLRRSVKRPKLTPADRFLWAWLCEIWNDWRSSLMIVKPATVIAWPSQKLSTLLDLESSSRPTWPPRGLARSTRSDPEAEPRESALGSSPNSWRTPQTQH